MVRLQLAFPVQVLNISAKCCFNGAASCGAVTTSAQMQNTSPSTCFNRAASCGAVTTYLVSFPICIWIASIEPHLVVRLQLNISPEKLVIEIASIEPHLAVRLQRFCVTHGDSVRLASTEPHLSVRLQHSIGKSMNSIEDLSFNRAASFGAVTTVANKIKSTNLMALQQSRIFRCGYNLLLLIAWHRARVASTEPHLRMWLQLHINPS